MYSSVTLPHCSSNASAFDVQSAFYQTTLYIGSTCFEWLPPECSTSMPGLYCRCDYMLSKRSAPQGKSVSTTEIREICFQVLRGKITQYSKTNSTIFQISVNADIILFQICITFLAYIPGSISVHVCLEA